jgi:hypothetical protein
MVLPINAANPFNDASRFEKIVPGQQGNQALNRSKSTPAKDLGFETPTSRLRASVASIGWSWHRFSATMAGQVAGNRFLQTDLNEAAVGAADTFACG